MQRLTDFSLRYPKAIIVACLVITAVMAIGASRVETVYGHRVLIGDDHPSIVELDRFIEKFGGGLPAIVMWDCSTSPACEYPTDRPSLELSEAFVRRLSPMSEVRNATGPSNAPLLTALEDGFTVRRLVEGGQIADDHAELSRLALTDELWVGQVVSRDGLAGLVVVEPISDQPPVDVVIVDELLELKEEWEAKGFTIALGGSIVNSVIGSRELIASQEVLTPFTVLLAGAVLIILSGSIRRSVFSLVAVGVALVWSMGVLGFLGWPQDSILQVLPPLILIVGICDSIHYLTYAQSEFDGRRGWADSLRNASQGVGTPCLLTTATTVGAFLSFLTSGLDTFVRFGAIASVGVALCLIVTFSLLPALCLLFDDAATSNSSGRGAGAGLSSIVASIAATSGRRSHLVLATVAAVLLVFGYAALTRLHVGVDWHESFGEKSSIVTWDRQLASRFGATDMRLELELSVPPSGLLSAPENISVLRETTEFLRGLDGLREPRSILDFMIVLRRLTSGDPAAYLPGTLAGNAELIELIGFGDRDLLAYWLSFDRQSARVSAQGNTVSSADAESIVRSVEAHLAESLPEGWGYSITGGVGISRDWVEEVQATQIRSFPVAFGAVWLLVALFLRSAVLGLASMIPSLIPVVVVLGGMGWLGMSLDVSRSMIAAIILGVGVDDSVHLLVQFRGAMAEGEGASAAMIRACETVGSAVITTSLALAVGFLSLMASAWQSISSFGFFVSLAILGALVSTLVVLPALVAAAERLGSSDA